MDNPDKCFRKNIPGYSFGGLHTYIKDRMHCLNYFPEQPKVPHPEKLT